MLALAAGCDNDDGISVYIASNIAKDDECVIDVSNERVARGIFNPDRGNYYEVFPLFVSQLRARATDVRADPNTIMITGAEVELQTPDGALIGFGGLPNPFTVTGSTTVPAGDGSDPGREVGYFQVIPSAYADAIAGNAAVTEVVAAVRAFGHTGGDVDVETDEWYWPIDICRGACLVFCATEDVPATASCYGGQDFTSVINCP